jgi:two-component system chemotaxis sensor kinase CheA
MQLLASLNREIALVRSGSDQGQFPILDILGNLRDETARKSGFEELHSYCAAAWDKLVLIVESGKPFNEPDIAWLNELLAQIKKLAGADAGTGVPNPAAVTPGPAPAQTTSSPVAPTGIPATNEETPLNLNLQNDADLLREFITESREHLDNIEQGALVLENQPANPEVLNTIFRAFHTFKGSAGFLNLVPINRLAHLLESLLDLARQSKLAIDTAIIEIILQGRDALKQYVDEIEGQLNGTRPAAPIIVATAELKKVVQSVIDAVNSGKAIATAAASSATQTTATASATQRGAAIKVNTEKLDGLLDLIGEMVIAQSLIGRDLDELAKLHPQSARNITQLNRITKELQRVSMSLRMVPIRSLFQKMARVARDIAAKQNKKVNFVTSGEDTELDRNVVEELNDPLLHMIRNSMDHGIEPPEKRAAAGKPPVGMLELRAFHRGGNIVVEVQDDGAGLNRDRILAKAVERGLVAPGAKLSDEEIYHFIFAAGFSTAEKVTDLSGRGVGLDVVRRNIEKLRGHIEIISAPSKGTLFKIGLPLTLAIIDGLVVEVGQERYILPTLSVRESLRPTPEMISHVQDRAEVVNVRGRLIPLVRLHQVFGVKPRVTDPVQGIILVVQSGVTVRCLLVDALLHKQEIVIKNLNEMMVHKNPAFAGATILGDGRVGLIIDVNALAQHKKKAEAKSG